MKASIISSLLAFGAVTSAVSTSQYLRRTGNKGILTFQFGEDTASTQEINFGTLPATIQKQIVSVNIGGQTKVFCNAFNNSEVIGMFTDTVDLIFAKSTFITAVSCDRRADEMPAIPAIPPVFVNQILFSGTPPFMDNGVALLKLQIEPNTFTLNSVFITSTALAVGGGVNLIGARIAAVTGNAKNPNKVFCIALGADDEVVGTFSLSEMSVFSNGRIKLVKSITCSQK